MNGEVEYNSVETGCSSKTVMMEFADSETPTKFPFFSPVNILKYSLLENQFVSRPDYLPGEILRTWREQQLARIRAIKGKYASVLTSSEEFAQRKREEIKLER